MDTGPLRGKNDSRGRTRVREVRRKRLTTEEKATLRRQLGAQYCTAFLLLKCLKLLT